MNFETVKLREQPGVLYVTLSNPPINLMNGTMIRELFQLSGFLMQRKDLKVVVIDSADPDFFIAHFDLDELEAGLSDPAMAGRYPDMNAVQALALNWQNLPQITIGKIDGRVRGGGLDLALAFDMRLASQSSLFCFPEASGHFLACGGGTTRMLLAAGPGRALEFLLSARDFTAAEAERYGLINRALPAGELDAYLADLVSRIAARAPDVIAMHRDVFRRVTAPMVDSFFAGLAAENDALRRALGSGRVQAGIAAHRARGQTRELELDLPATLAALNADR
ncbi:MULTISPECIES: enoyl-CoA hydratase/isomerase family protein [Bradyrhizobium]|jgi:enoyl-CoA hydratase/carnithine racemase|uniref:enoyl-CoA hydratase/isomerase family protein n=1 Tax=Bradyrhizobium TaxID=374 RepID=UPI0003A61F4F|nr:enoyl-CoA hydratase/isomerase family protein [Bradyrhizobium denitrificans]MCL8482868.1 enoyl-CoA hydratase/isomerase family protein [Bradyrhizobium denitrificans]